MTRRLQNPLVLDNCPDPAVTRAGDVWVMASTSNHNDAPDKFPLRVSKDLQSWEIVGHVFPRGQIPQWATADFWAPELHRMGDRWVCFYTARNRDGILSVGVAEADAPTGPYRDLGKPLLEDSRLGLIDSHLYRDATGTYWLSWKVDGNGQRPQEPTPIYLQEIATDAHSLRGERYELITNDLPWEDDVVEGPWIVKRGEYFYLFYAAHKYDTDHYATGVARARTLTGPYEKYPTPILASRGRFRGPGHGCVVEDGREDWFVYHAWEEGKIGGTWPRMPCIGAIRWGANGWPTIEPCD